jgi:hypothetical protein
MMNESPSLDIDELFLELEHLKRKRDEVGDTKEKAEKKMKSHEDVDEVVSGNDVMLPSSNLSHTLGRSQLFLNSPQQDSHLGSGNNNGTIFPSESSHTLGRSQLPPLSTPPQISASSDAKSTGRPQLTSSNPLGEFSALSSLHTIGCAERSFSQGASTKNDEDADTAADTAADVSCELESESDLFTRFYDQGRTTTRTRLVSSHLSPKSQPKMLIVPTTSIFPNTNDDAEFEWDAFKQTEFLRNPGGSVYSFESMAKQEFKMSFEYEATATNAEEDSDSMDDKNEEVNNGDDAIKLDFQEVESEEDPDDPDDYALSHWGEICGGDESEGEEERKGHGMLTRGRARLLYGDAI